MASEDGRSRFADSRQPAGNRVSPRRRVSTAASRGHTERVRVHRLIFPQALVWTHVLSPLPDAELRPRLNFTLPVGLRRKRFRGWQFGRVSRSQCVGEPECVSTRPPRAVRVRGLTPIGSPESSGIAVRNDVLTLSPPRPRSRPTLATGRVKLRGQADSASDTRLTICEESNAFRGRSHPASSGSTPGDRRRRLPPLSTSGRIRVEDVSGLVRCIGTTKLLTHRRNPSHTRVVSTNGFRVEQLRASGHRAADDAIRSE